MAITRAVVSWYLEHYHGGPNDLGMAATFCSRDNVGSFAVDREALEQGEDSALFRLLVTVAMFQRLRDALVMNILRGISPEDAAELTSAERLAALASSYPCGNAMTNNVLLSRCDLTKDADKLGACEAAATVACSLKRHTVLLRRYGHFGKMPTSAALVVRESGGSMTALRERAIASQSTPLARAQALEQALAAVWRVSDKIASFYLSLICAPNMGLSTPPWGQDLDWSWFVVVDGNVDLALASIGYAGSKTYSARRSFVRALAEQVDLSSIDSRLPPYHPRLVQQALYLFMSTSNRRAATIDCSKRSPSICGECEPLLRSRCGLAR